METRIDLETGEVIEEKEVKEYRNEPYQDETPAEIKLNILYGLDKQIEAECKPYQEKIDEIQEKYKARRKKLEKEIRDECMYRGKTIDANHMQCVFVPSDMRLNSELLKKMKPDVWNDYSEETRARTSIRKRPIKKE